MIKKKVTETNDDGSTHSFYIDENGDIDHAEIVCEMTPQQVHKYISDEAGRWEFPIEARGIKYQRRPNFWETIKDMIKHVAKKSKP